MSCVFSVFAFEEDGVIMGFPLFPIHFMKTHQKDRARERKGENLGNLEKKINESSHSAQSLSHRYHMNTCTASSFSSFSDL